MKTNRKLKQDGDVLDELLTPAMQFFKKYDKVSTFAKPYNHPSDKTAVEIEKCHQIMKQQANTDKDQTYPDRTSNQTKKSL